MKTNQMYRGEFRIKKSPYPNLQLKDWPASCTNISFLENRLSYFLKDDCPIATPVAYLQGIEYKLRHMRKELSAALHSPSVKTPTPPKKLAAAWKAMQK